MKQDQFDQLYFCFLAWIFIWMMTEFLAPVFHQYMYEAILPQPKECEDPKPYIYNYSEPAIEVYDED